MKDQIVYVITNYENGWDNINGVFLSQQGAFDYLKEMRYTQEAIEADEIEPMFIHKKHLEE